MRVSVVSVLVSLCPSSLCFIRSRCRHQSFALAWVVHRSFVRSLLLSLHSREWVVARFDRSVLGDVDRLRGHKGASPRVFLQFLHVVALLALQELVDARLAQQVAFHLLRYCLSRARWAVVVHPVHACLSLPASSGLLQTLQLFHLPLFFSLLEELVRLLALIESLFLLLPDAFLVFHQQGMP